ncbi:MAG: bifunctional ornithine acetyltransferase/N-acetylglutamate synthase, partial [Oscillospiraceae bacterium]
MNIIEGGICAARGYKAAGVSCGIRKKGKKDLALIVSEKRAATAGVYTKNLVKGAPITVTQAHIADGFSSAIIANSGNANTCNANGIEIAEGMCALTEKYLGIPAADVTVASTGVIGQTLSL